MTAWLCAPRRLINVYSVTKLLSRSFLWACNSRKHEHNELHADTFAVHAHALNAMLAPIDPARAPTRWQFDTALQDWGNSQKRSTVSLVQVLGAGFLELLSLSLLSTPPSSQGMLLWRAGKRYTGKEKSKKEQAKTRWNRIKKKKTHTSK